jgi:hypothetical protein
MFSNKMFTEHAQGHPDATNLESLFIGKEDATEEDIGEASREMKDWKRELYMKVTSKNPTSFDDIVPFLELDFAERLKMIAIDSIHYREFYQHDSQYYYDEIVTWENDAEYRLEAEDSYEYPEKFTSQRFRDKMMIFHQKVTFLLKVLDYIRDCTSVSGGGPREPIEEAMEASAIEEPMGADAMEEHVEESCHFSSYDVPIFADEPSLLEMAITECAASLEDEIYVLDGEQDEGIEMVKTILWEMVNMMKELKW